MIKETRYLVFRRVDTGATKTETHAVESRGHGNVLGFVKWYGPWRQYCFYSEEGCVFNDGCLQDIAAYSSELMQERRKGAR